MSQANIMPDPDCRDGKHASCHGYGWNTFLDEPADCPCDCHPAAARKAAIEHVRWLSDLVAADRNCGRAEDAESEAETRTALLALGCTEAELDQ